MSIELTNKMEAFAQAYIELGNASEAYRRCYDVSPTTADNVIWVKASELLKNGKVAVRVLQLREENAKRHAITIDSLTEMLKDDRKLARDEKEASAAVAAVMAIAKLHGLVVEKKNVTSDNRHSLSAEAVPPLVEFARGLVTKHDQDAAQGTVPN